MPTNVVLMPIGFMKFWYESTVSAFIAASHIQYSITSSKTEEGKPFSLSDVKTSFYLLLLGYATASIIFLIEKFIIPPKKLGKIESCVCPVRFVKNVQLKRRKRSMTRRLKRKLKRSQKSNVSYQNERKSKREK